MKELELRIVEASSIRFRLEKISIQVRIESGLQAKTVGALAWPCPELSGTKPQESMA